MCAYIGEVQGLIYLQSIGTRVRLTRCRSYVVLVRHAKQPLSSALPCPALLCSAAHLVPTRHSQLLALRERE